MNWSTRVVGALAVVALFVSGCGGSAPTRELSEEAAAGREVALSRGCSACHGENGEGSVGPAWEGLAGSTVALEGGGAVVADTEYLRRALVDPQAEIVEGTTIEMPVTALSEAEIVALIAYIEELR
ncbi:MAG: cytochrome c [Acidimicrobiia bacterium]|nr:cytochrome c [Acidimicrobiia bacterium]MDX2468089.1 cytochrome c [Acidimicrobiia bacterium]